MFKINDKEEKLTKYNIFNLKFRFDRGNIVLMTDDTSIVRDIDTGKFNLPNGSYIVVVWYFLSNLNNSSDKPKVSTEYFFSVYYDCKDSDISI